MPLVELREPEKIRSPIRTLLRPFADSPAIIAPERKDEFKAVVRSNGVRVTLDPERNRFLFCMEPVPEGEAKRVWVGLAVLERIWAYAYSFQRFYDVRGEHPQGTLLTPANTNSIAPAWALMNLAYGAEQRKDRMAWPPELPNPEWTQDETVVLANNFFLYICAFMLTHEVGHFILNHAPSDVVPPDQAIREEYAADRWACDLLMGRGGAFSIDENHLAARANGIATGMALLATVELGIHPDHPRDHPKIPERLLTFFTEYLPETEGQTAALRDYPSHFVSCILYALMLNKKIDYPYGKVHDTITDLLIDLIPYF